MKVQVTSGNRRFTIEVNIVRDEQVPPLPAIKQPA
jgi:hypothetical protein